MSKAHIPSENKNPVLIIRWKRENPLTQEEAEANLHKEGYESFCWYDVPGASYPNHRHLYDECLWILRGEIQITLGDEKHKLTDGDKIYLPARTVHTAEVPPSKGVTYLVGQKRRR